MRLASESFVYKKNKNKNKNKNSKFKGKCFQMLLFHCGHKQVVMKHFLGR